MSERDKKKHLKKKKETFPFICCLTMLMVQSDMLKNKVFLREKIFASHVVTWNVNIDLKFEGNFKGILEVKIKI